MARRRTEDSHENHERWLVSYADFITLLFAFFVVMYAISSVNEGKYRVLSSSLTSAFRDDGAQGSVDAQAAIGIALPIPGLGSAAERERQREEKLNEASRQIKRAMGDLITQGQVRVNSTPLGLTIDIDAGMLFTPGDARLEPAAVKILEDVAATMVGTDFPIVIEGHTDNTPISNARFPSNWELSGVRAASVVRVFIDSGISAVRLTAIGYADQRPMADNATEQGRLRNRRVSIGVMSKPDSARR